MNPTYTDKLGTAITQGMLVPHAAKQQFRQTKGMEAQQRLLNSGMTDPATIEAMTKIGEDWNVPAEVTNNMIQQAYRNDLQKQQNARAEENAKVARDNLKLRQLQMEATQRDLEAQKVAAAANARLRSGVFKDKQEEEIFIGSLSPEAQAYVRKDQKAQLDMEYMRKNMESANKAGRILSDSELDAYGVDDESKAAIQRYKDATKNSPAGSARIHNDRLATELDNLARSRARREAQMTPPADLVKTVGLIIEDMESNTGVYSDLSKQQKYLVHFKMASDFKQSGGTPPDPAMVASYAAEIIKLDPDLPWYEHGMVPDNVKREMRKLFGTKAPAAPASSNGEWGIVE